MKRIMTLLLGLAAVSGVNGAVNQAPAQEPGFFSKNWQKAKDFGNEHFVNYYKASDVGNDTDDAGKKARKMARIRRASGSAVSLAGAGLAAGEILSNRNFLLEMLLNNTALGNNEKARKFMSHRATKIITSLLEAIALDEIAGAITDKAGRRGLVSGLARDGYKKYFGKKDDAAAGQQS